MRAARFVCVSLVLLASAPLVAAAGPKSIKKLPFLIDKPGHYVLTRSLELTKTSDATGSDGIRITADHVTVDLGGYEISTSLPTAGGGINASGSVHDVHVLNGSVRGFDVGVLMLGDGPFSCEDVQVFDSKAIGLWLGGQHSSVRRCLVRNTGGGDSNQIVQGIRLDADFGEVLDCQVAEFTRDDPSFPVTGIYAGSFVVVRGNSVASFLNAAALTTGIEQLGEASASDNVIVDFAIGAKLGNTAYLDNATYNCTTKYSGGQDAGGNK